MKNDTYKNIKGVTIHTKDGDFTIENLSKVDGYGTFLKDRNERIVSTIKNKIGLMKFFDGQDDVKVDLTRQNMKPDFIYYEYIKNELV